MRTYRAAIVGCGPRGNSQAEACKAHPAVELVALCDLDEQRLRAAGERHGVRALYPDLETMLAQEQPDIVHIATRTDLHSELTLAVLRPGVNVVVEKPLALTLAAADRMVAAAEEAGVQLAVHHQWSLSPQQRKAKEMMAAGAIGELRAVQSSGKGYYGCYGLMNIGTHILDQICNFCGEPEWCFASVTVGERDMAPDDIVQMPHGMGLGAGERIFAHYAFPAGVYATSEYFPRDPIDVRAYGVDLIGTEGILSLRGAGQGVLYYYPDKVWAPQNADRWQPVHLSEEESTLYGHSFAALSDLWMVEEMVNCLCEGREHATSGRRGRVVLEMIMAVYESQRRGMRVKLPLAEREHPLQRWLEETGRRVPALEIVAYREWLPQVGKSK